MSGGRASALDSDEHGRLRRHGVARESFSRTRGSVYNAAAGRFLGAAPSTLPCLPPTMPRRAGAPARLATATPTYLLYSDVAKASGGTRVLGARGQKH